MLKPHFQDHIPLLPNPDVGFGPVIKDVGICPSELETQGAAPHNGARNKAGNKE